MNTTYPKAANIDRVVRASRRIAFWMSVGGFITLVGIIATIGFYLATGDNVAFVVAAAVTFLALCWLMVLEMRRNSAYRHLSEVEVKTYITLLVQQPVSVARRSALRWHVQLNGVSITLDFPGSQGDAVYFMVTKGQWQSRSLRGEHELIQFLNSEVPRRAP